MERLKISQNTIVLSIPNSEKYGISPVEDSVWKLGIPHEATLYTA